MLITIGHEVELADVCRENTVNIAKRREGGVEINHKKVLVAPQLRFIEIQKEDLNMDGVAMDKTRFRVSS